MPICWRNRFRPDAEENDQLCPLCRQETETLEHFLLDCEELVYLRNRYQWWNVINREESLRILLCFDNNLEGRALLKETGWLEERG